MREAQIRDMSGPKRKSYTLISDPSPRLQRRSDRGLPHPSQTVRTPLFRRAWGRCLGRRRLPSRAKALSSGRNPDQSAAAYDLTFRSAPATRNWANRSAFHLADQQFGAGTTSWKPHDTIGLPNSAHGGQTSRRQPRFLRGKESRFGFHQHVNQGFVRTK